MSQEAREPLTNERPTQSDSTAPQASPQEVLVLETLRKALCESGIDHDCWDYIAQRALDGLKANGLVPTAVDYQAVVRSVEPYARIRTGHEVWRPFHEPGYPRTRERAVVIATAIVASTPGIISILDEFGKGTSALHVRVDRKSVV